MECTLATLIACFSWSGLYIDADVIALDKTLPHQEWRVTEYRGDGVVETIGRYEWTDRADNPYGSVAIGFAVPIRNVTLSAEVSHTSSLRTDGDRGINAISLRARWYPFR